MSWKGEIIMTRQGFLRTLAVLGVAIMGVAAPVTVKADALPCTVMYLNQAKGMQATANAELTAAQAALAQVQAKVDTFVAKGETNTQAYFDAANELLAAKGKVETKQQELASANSFVSDCQSKYAVEDNYDKAYQALQDVNVVQATKLNADNAQILANAAEEAVNNTKAAIAGYQAQLSTSPAVQDQINALNALLAVQVADLNAKKAAADAGKAGFEQSLNSKYASYNKAAIDYIYNRDDMRDHTVTDLNKDGVVDGEDFFIGIGYVQGGTKSEPLYRYDHYIEEALNEIRNMPPVYKQGLCVRWH